MAERTEVLVAGGGYAGVMSANRLTRRPGVQVTLINPRAAFVERIRLHQLVGGSDDAVVDYRTVLSDAVHLRIDSVARIDAPRRRVTLASGETVDYDHLIYAVGSGSADHGVPGVAEFAYPLAALEDAERLRLALDSAPAGAAVTVVGAGPLGIEIASELATTHRAVTLVCGDLLDAHLHPRGRRAALRQLTQLGVTVVEGSGTRVTAVAPDHVALDGGGTLPSDVTIWAAGFGTPGLAAASGLRTDPAGRLLTDETLTSVDDERIVAAGDAAAPSGLPYRMSCQAAVQLGPQAAETVLSRIAGEPPTAVTAGFVAECISLGRRAGVFQSVHWNDAATPVAVGGWAAALLKEIICRGTIWQLAFEARRPGLVRWWAKDATRRRLLRDALPVDA